jgi:ATP-dependent Clp endopeptidase proteolytic subunit ClpP
MKSWYAIRAATSGTAGSAAGSDAEILIYDEIGAFGVTAKQFTDDLKAAGEAKTITLRLNSPGGSVFDGIAIHNALKRHPARTVVHIDGLAASIASVIAMAGDEVAMPENAMLMIHDPSGVVVGTSSDMRSTADALDRIKGGLIAAYRDKTGKPDDEIERLMAEETWLTASEAVALGFADRIEKPVRIAASFDLTRFRRPPAAGTPPVADPSLRNQQQETAMTDVIPEPIQPDPATPADEPPQQRDETREPDLAAVEARVRDDTLGHPRRQRDSDRRRSRRDVDRARR